MEVFKLGADYDVLGNSPWDALWYDGDDDDLDALDCQMRLMPIWKPPLVRLEKRDQRPDIYIFQVYYVCTRRISHILYPLVSDSVEFLPIRISERKRLYVMHPVARIDLSLNAK